MNDEWGTPDELFGRLNEEFNFNLDLCARPDGANAKCAEWSYDVKLFAHSLIPEAHPQDVYWMNPPYSRGNINMCMEQAVKLARRDHTVICLVRFDPSTQWFQKYVGGVASEVRMLDRRVKFMGAPSAYNFPCCVVVYDPDHFDLDAPTTYNIWGW